MKNDFVDYKLLQEQIQNLAKEDSWFVPLFSNACALIMQTIPALNWAGFYIVKNGDLVLGPFQGELACIHIKKGKGVCGTALETNNTMLVPNVHLFSGHIACSALSKSELVVPLRKNGNVCAVLDLDSPQKNRFSESDKIEFEKIAQILESSVEFNSSF